MTEDDQITRLRGSELASFEKRAVKLLAGRTVPKTATGMGG
jgi:hypothetical protein